MIDQSRPANSDIHFEAIRLARACRSVVQACLREDEWRLADEEFYKLIRETLEKLSNGG